MSDTMTAMAQLTALDRCDRCGAQAYIKATMPEGGELLFCGHHGAEHRPKLKAKGYVIHDETKRLQATG